MASAAKSWGTTMTKVDMGDDEIARRMRLIHSVVTPTQQVINRVVSVESDHLVIRSGRTDKERKIPFSDLRQAGQITRNGVIVRVIAEVLGLYSGEDVGDLVDHPADADPFLEWYETAKYWVESFSEWDVKWLSQVSFATVTASDFLSQYAWAVYASGFKATYLKQKWPALEEAWNEFDPATINEASRAAALRLFGHEGKGRAVLTTARLIQERGWPAFREEYCSNTTLLTKLDWIGHTNAQFLARNLGLADVGKPDRWIVRAAEHGGFSNPTAMFEYIKEATGDSHGNADLIIWAYLSANPGGVPPRHR